MALNLSERQVKARDFQQRRVPVYGLRGDTIAWYEHVAAWMVYNARYHQQSAERLAERGGFGHEELLAYLGHEPLTVQLCGSAGNE